MNDGIYIKNGNQNIFIPSNNININLDNIQNNLLILNNKQIIKQLISDLLILNKWNKFNNFNKLVDEIYYVIENYLTYKNIDDCINGLKFLLNKDKFNLIKKIKNNKLNIFKYVKSYKQLIFFHNKELLLKLIKINDRTIGDGEIFLTLFTNCYKGKIVDLFIIDSINKEYIQLELKGNNGRIGSELNARYFLDKVKDPKSKEYTKFNIDNNKTDIQCIKKIINSIPKFSIDEQIEYLYEIRTEKNSINSDYFKEQIRTILEEFDNNINYEKLILAIQIYSYCVNIVTNYLILINNLDLCIIKINCLWGIYEQLLEFDLKINFNITTRKGFGITYKPQTKNK